MSLSKTTKKPVGPDPRLFKAYTEMPERLHPRVWTVLRWLGVACALGIVAANFLDPSLGLLIFWGVFVPVVPLIFLVAPALWRNVCPMASLNRGLPRLCPLEVFYEFVCVPVAVLGVAGQKTHDHGV
jgi:hypothetical protein